MELIFKTSVEECSIDISLVQKEVGQLQSSVSGSFSVSRIWQLTEAHPDILAKRDSASPVVELRCGEDSFACLEIVHTSELNATRGSLHWPMSVLHLCAMHIYLTVLL